jgi:uncharacterized surface protein with fasciclin (FAS1) repeats
MMEVRAKLLSILVAATALCGCQQAEQTAKEPERRAAADSQAAPAKTASDPAPSSSNIGATLVGSADHSTLVQGLKGAGIAETLNGAGPYTVFAPTNAAFQKLPPGAAQSMMQPASKAQLTQLLTYHIVPGLVTAKDLAGSIERGGGKAQLATIAGGTLTVSQSEGAIIVTDGKGGQARVTRPDMMQSNGVVHVLDAVLMPQDS